MQYILRQETLYNIKTLYNDKWINHKRKYNNSMYAPNDIALKCKTQKSMYDMIPFIKSTKSQTRVC